MRPLALACFLATALMGQDIDLRAFAQQFAQTESDAPRFAVVALPGRDPLVLVAGRHNDGTPVTSASLVAIGTLARQLYGDALGARHRMPLDTVEALRLGEHSLPIQELLRGSDRIPDYTVWPGGPWQTMPMLDAKTLTECTQLSFDAGVRFEVFSGVSDLVLLDPLLLSSKQTDVTAALRIALAPLVPGIDPRDVRSLNAAQRARLVNAREDDASWLMATEPRAARLVISIKSLAAWIDWRRRDPAGLIRGKRAGMERLLERYDERPREWTTGSKGMATIAADAYPAQKVMLVTSGRTIAQRQALRLALREALFGPPSRPMPVPDPGGAFVENRPRPNLSPLGRRIWRDPKTGTRVQSDGKAIHLTRRDGEVLIGHGIEQPADTAWVLRLEDPDRRTRHRLILMLAEEPRRLRAVWQRSNEKGGLFPQYLVLEQEK